MTNLIPQVGKTIWPFHNPVDKSQRTYIMGNDPKTKANFGILNRELGRYSENCLDISLGLGVLKDYVTSFLDPSENVLLNIINKCIHAVSEFFYGQRDKQMYKIFGHGVDADVYNETTYTPNSLGKTGAPSFQENFRKDGLFVDDLGENIGQKQAYGEEIVPFWGWLATISASVKPIVAPITAFLPKNFKAAADSLIDTGARSWWRMRMFGHSLHANFLTSVWNLIKNGVLSFVSNDAKNKLDTQKKQLGSFAREYFEKTGNNSVSEGRSDLGVYFSMLTDRVKTHWNNATTKNEELLEKAKKDGTITDADGYIGRDLKLAAISELSAPFCSAIGLVGTLIFEPLRLIWNFAGFETGKNLITALSASRKATHLFNYGTRFIAHEVFSCDNNVFKDIEKAVKDGTATEIQKQWYLARSTRRRNGYMGLLMAAGNIIEPFAHLRGYGIGENKLNNFLFNIFTRFNDTGLLRFFSTRRETIGREALIQSIAAQEGKDLNGLNGITLTAEQIEGRIQTLYNHNNIGEHFDGITQKVIAKVEQVKESVSTEKQISPAYIDKTLVA